MGATSYLGATFLYVSGGLYFWEVVCCVSCNLWVFRVTWVCEYVRVVQMRARENNVCGGLDVSFFNHFVNCGSVATTSKGRRGFFYIRAFRGYLYDFEDTTTSRGRRNFVLGFGGIFVCRDQGTMGVNVGTRGLTIFVWGNVGDACSFNFVTCLVGVECCHLLVKCHCVCTTGVIRFRG